MEHVPELAGGGGLLQNSPVIPDIKYATSGDLQIAYQVVGDGPVDVALAFDWGSNIELVWEHPQTERFLRRFASYGRLIFFDMRGIGLSDPVENLPPLEEWMDDVRTVLDAVGSDRAALVGHGHAGQLCMLVAASHPDLVQAPPRLPAAIASSPPSPSPGCWPPSTARPVPSAASGRLSVMSRRWACMSGQACTPARSSCSAGTWAGSPSPSPPA
jgi:pimeloyl-ACP methyl ester carboxylesterase